nr:hypothetical protein [Tanacetum cinerariifolium]
MSESAKRHEENSNLIKEIYASTDAAIRNQGASIKSLEIQIRQMIKNCTLMYETRQTMILFPSRLNGYYCKEKKGSYGPKFFEAYSKASHIDNSIPRKEKDPGSFTLLCFINNVCFDNALVDLGANVSVMPLWTYLNLGLGELVHTKLTVELADRTMKYPKGIAQNVLVGIGKFVFPIDIIILDMPEDIKVSLIRERSFLSTAHAKIDVYKRKITLRIREERIIFISVKHASSLIKRVYMLSLREIMELDLEARLMGDTLVFNRSLDPMFEDYIELNDLKEPIKHRRNQGNEFMPIIKEGEQKACILEFKQRYFEDYCSDNQYAVSIKEDTTGLGFYSAGDVLNYAFLTSRLQSDSLQTKLLRHFGRIGALEQEMRDLDVENKQMKVLKASYGVTTPQELRRNLIKERMIITIVTVIVKSRVFQRLNFINKNLTLTLKPPITYDHRLSYHFKMVSIIPLGQKNILAEYMILFGADNRPPMLDKDLYDSWKSRMEIYMQNKEHRRMILESVENGPLIWPTVEKNGVIKTKKYVELSVAEKIQANYDMKATNIILQGFSIPVFSLRDDPIACLNKAMAFLTAIASSSSGGNNASGQARVVKCYNYQGKGHMARQCTQPKRLRNAAWYKGKAMLAEAQEARQVDEEQLTFLTKDLNTYDSDGDDVSNAKAVLMANISNYGYDVISEEHEEKVEAQPRKVNKKNRVVEPIHNVVVKQSQLNVNFKLICATSKVVPPKKTTSYSVKTQKPRLKVYNRKLRIVKNVGLSKKAKVVESKNANHSEPNHSWGSNALDIPLSSSLVMIAHELSKFLGIVTFGNDHIARIMGYGDYELGNLAKDGLGRGIPRLKFQKDHLCSTCALGKSKKSSHEPKAKDINQEKLYLLHMDLYGLMHVVSINRKRLQCMTPATSRSGLVPNIIFQQPCIPPNRDDWDHLFQPIFDEYYNPLTIVVSLVPVAAVPRAVDLADSLVSMSID